MKCIHHDFEKDFATWDGKKNKLNFNSFQTKFILKKNKESHWLSVSVAKLLEYYSSNIYIQNFNQF